MRANNDSLLFLGSSFWFLLFLFDYCVILSIVCERRGLFHHV